MRPTRLFLFAVGVFVAVASPAFAQSTRRPDLNLFGRGQRSPEQELSLRAGLGGSFYDTITPLVALPGRPLPPDHGWGSFGSAGLAYNLRLANITFGGSVGSFATYYPQRAKAFQIRSSSGGGASTSWGVALSPKTDLSIGVSLRYSPIAVESTVPLVASGGGEALNVTNDSTLAFLPRDTDNVKGSYISTLTDVLLSRKLTRRWSLSASYGAGRDFSFGTEGQQLGGLWSQHAGSALHFAVTRSLSVRGGYQYQESHYRDSRPFRSNAADLGVEFGKGLALQLTRRTTLSFGGGAAGYVDRAGTQRYRANGNAQLQHVMGRTWSTSLDYQRGLDFSQLVFQEPLLSDSVSAGLNGLVTRRLGLHASGSGQRGAVGFVAAGHGVVRIATNAGVQLSMARRLALSLDYSYYSFRYEAEVLRPVGLPSRSASQGVSVQLSTWAPIYQRGRSNASR